MQFCVRSLDHVLPNRREYRTYTAPVEKWVEILALAQKWEFKEVERLCIRELEKLLIPPVEKIHIYQTFHLDRSLLVKPFEELVLRDKPIDMEEGLKLGLRTSLQLAQAREVSRSPKLSTIQVNDSDLRSVIQDVLGIKQTIELIGSYFLQFYENLTDGFCCHFLKTSPPHSPPHPPHCDNPKIANRRRRTK